MPSTAPRAPAGLEGWLTGTPQELGAAREALGRLFAIVVESAREPLGRGRYRQYLRATPLSVPPGNTELERASEQCEIPFPSPSTGT
ncbi:hypothetical protein Prum_060980 [Phytohabitans rumicis]|uniref:Uncharacterized protein n=1 Tax=Phytohabitans rumicis TaxID=1076125 RepID=A0A6V8LEE4_9ACTN|nr:hypothetical protein Prum_060980 [Phytohabitans rumicis]